MAGVIRAPVCVTGEVVEQAVIPLATAVQNIHLILLHWQKAMGRRAFVLQKKRI